MTVASIVLLAVATTFPRRNPLVEERGWDAHAFDPHAIIGHLLHAAERWDARWYLTIASDGYGDGGRRAAFFPLYPMLLRGGATLGLPPWLVAAILGVVGALVATVVLHAVTLRVRGGGPDAALTTVTLWSFAPFAVVLGAAYPEALLAALLAGTWLAALERRVAAAVVLGGLAMLTKPLGVAALPLVWMAAGESGVELQVRRRGAAIGGAVAIAAIWPAWLLLRFGDPLRFATAQDGWQRSIDWTGPLSGAAAGLRAGVHGVRRVGGDQLDLTLRAVANLGDPVGLGMQDLVNLVAMAVLVVGTVAAWRMFGRAAGCSCALVAVVPLSLPSGDVPLLSAPRFLLVAVPAWVAAGVLIARARNAVAADAVLVATAAIGGTVTFGWATWQWLG